MEYNIRKYFLFLLLFGVSWGARAQGSAYEEYIHRYSDMAVDQMRRYGVPASITLAQGLLESSAGRSRLATKGNNHFGIKCGGSWRGPYMLANDDAPNERFRVYKNAKESYEDHSRFLVENRRYAALFRLDRRDYKGWARGLKEAGYATNPAYAGSLITLIERYDLYKYDSRRHGGVKKHDGAKNKDGAKKKEKASPFGREVFRCNGQYYVVARPGDTYASLAKVMKTRESKLRKYNDVDKQYRLREGDIVYLGMKRKRADSSLKRKYHVMQEGESLYGISQRYGIRLTSLCKRNPMRADEHFKVGDRIRIR